MSYLRKNLKKLYRVALTPKVRSEISRLYNEPDVPSQSIAKALEETLKDELSQEERGWIDEIESLRAELNASKAKISIIDYGAGSPTDNLTEAEMNQGKIISKTVGGMCQSASKPYFWALLLFKLIREFKPSTCLEMGTCLGISASYQATALKLNRSGKIITLEGAESLASLATQNFQMLNLDNVNVVVGPFHNTLDKVLDKYKPIDYMFIDGHHDEKATLDYFEQVYPFLSEKAMLLFDDISWSNGMKRAWAALEVDQRINLSVDLSTIGVCIIDNSIKQKRSFKIPVI